MTRARLHADEVEVEEELVRRLIVDQHPVWAGLEVRRIPSTGTDHAVFRLGEEFVVRMPRIGWAEQQVARESACLPMVAGLLPVDVPTPAAVGEPGHGYPFRWLVSPWVEGRDLLEVLTSGERIDGRQLGADLAAFLRALQVIDTIDAPLPGKRGRALIDRDEVVRSGVAELNGEFDCDRLLDVWDEALAAEPWPGPPVWVHGDLLPGNLVVADGRLAGVIDWSATGAGDSACDLMVAWSLPADARAHFRDDLKVDDATWARAQGWVIEQAVPFIPYYEHTLPAAVAVTSQRLAAMLAEA